MLQVKIGRELQILVMLHNYDLNFGDSSAKAVTSSV